MTISLAATLASFTSRLLGAVGFVLLIACGQRCQSATRPRHRPRARNLHPYRAGRQAMARYPPAAGREHHVGRA